MSKVSLILKSDEALSNGVKAFRGRIGPYKNDIDEGILTFSEVKGANHEVLVDDVLFFGEFFGTILIPIINNLNDPDFSENISQNGVLIKMNQESSFGSLGAAFCKVASYQTDGTIVKLIDDKGVKHQLYVDAIDFMGEYFGKCRIPIINLSARS